MNYWLAPTEAAIQREERKLPASRSATPLAASVTPHALPTVAEEELELS